MEAEILLHRLCERHGIDPDRGARLLPLVRWALEGPQDARERILRLVEASLKTGEQVPPRTLKNLHATAERALLVAVARVLHEWSPDEGLLDPDRLKLRSLGPAAAELAEDEAPELGEGGPENEPDPPEAEGEDAA